MKSMSVMLSLLTSLCLANAAQAGTWLWPNKNNVVQVVSVDGDPAKLLKRNKLAAFKVAFQNVDPSVKANVKLLEFDARMPAHNHGMLTKPNFKSDGKGYIIEGINLHMSGLWELTFRIQTSQDNQTLVVPIQVP